jgi:hypothetical protein
MGPAARHRGSLESAAAIQTGSANPASAIAR